MNILTDITADGFSESKGLDEIIKSLRRFEEKETDIKEKIDRERIEIIYKILTEFIREESSRIINFFTRIYENKKKGVKKIFMILCQ
ncbi:hypothetical protein YN1_5240 [Nanoarchaeota archaeon]